MNNNCWLRSICNGVDCESSMCIRKYYETKYFKNSLIPENKWEKQKLILDSDLRDKSAFDVLSNIDIASFVNKGNNLYLYSKITGNGKTSWSIRLAQDLIHARWGHCPSNDCIVLFVNVPKYLLALKENITERSEYITHIRKYILDADLVIWDDIGTKAATQFEHENLLSIIDTRINNSKSNIYTSNLSLQELHEAVGDRLYSRIRENAVNIELIGLDKRGVL